MINAYLRTTVTKRTPSVNDFNEVSYTDSPIKARWTRKQRVVEIDGGEQVVSTAQILILDQTISNRHKIKYDSVEYAVVAIQECKDFSVRCLEVFLR
jgi:hypothetical protein